jgi:hypothetical protein
MPTRFALAAVLLAGPVVASAALTAAAQERLPWGRTAEPGYPQGQTGESEYRGWGQTQSGPQSAPGAQTPAEDPYASPAPGSNNPPRGTTSRAPRNDANAPRANAYGGDAYAPRYDQRAPRADDAYVPPRGAYTQAPGPYQPATPAYPESRAYGQPYTPAPAYGEPYTPNGEGSAQGYTPYPYDRDRGLPPYQDGTNTFTSHEILDAGHGFFGSVSKGLASVVEYAFQQQGRPNGYILGQDAGGAFVAGVRYGEGILYTKDAGTRRVYWQGPSIGWDAGAEGSKVMVLVYNLREPEDVYQRFGGIDGSAYLVGGVGLTFLKNDDIVLAPIRAGVGVRLGANVGYLKYTPTPTWNPF